MNDIFNEHLVKKQQSIKDYFYKALIALTAIVIMTLGILFADIMVVLIIGGVFFGVYFAYKQFDIEYEYILTNEDLDVDKIIAREKRKHVLSLKVPDIEILAPYDEKKIRELTRAKTLKYIDVSSGSVSAERWYAIYGEGQGKTLLIFEPPQKMRDGIEKFIPRRIKK